MDRCELVGRSVEIDAVRAALDAGRGVVLHGEAGVGKTALVHAAVPTGTPYGGAIGSLSWMSFWPLRRAFPSLEDHTWTGDAEHVADRLGAELTGRPLVLEDLHWADTATLDVAEQLAARLPVVVTLRRGDPGTAAVLERLVAAGATVLDVAPLDGTETATLARRRNPALAGAAVESVVRRSGGNPLLIEELARADGVVDTLRLALGLRLDAVTADAREGMLLLAAADRALPADQVPGAEELVAAGLAVATDDAVEVRHRLLAETVLDTAEEKRRRAAHRRLVELLPAAADRARHLHALGDMAGAHAAALAAVEQATTPGERLSHLLHAVESAPLATRDRLLLRAAAAANEAAHHDEALRLLEQLPPTRHHEPRFLRLMGEARFGLGDAEGWQKTVIEGAAAAEEPADRFYFAAEESAVAYFLHGDPARSADLAAEVLPEAIEAGLPHAVLLRRIGAAEYLLGRPGWPTTLERAVAAARSEGDTAGAFAALNNLISGHESAGDPATARRLADEAVAEATALRLGRWARHMECRRLSLAVYAGEHALVEELARPLLTQPLMPQTRGEVAFYLGCSYADLGRVPEALAVLEEHQDAWALRSSDYHAARALAFLSDGRPAAALGEREPFFAAEPVSSMVTIMEPVFAWAAWHAGRPLPQHDTDLPSWGMLAGVAPELAGIALLRDGDHETAVERFAGAERLYSAYHQRRTVRCRWARGLALARAGRRDEAALVLHAVVEDARARGLVPVSTLAEQSLREIGERPGRDADTELSAGRRGLSPQEVRVLGLVGEGLSDAQIAHRMGVSVRTVQTQVASARSKLGATTRLHAVQLLATVGG